MLLETIRCVDGKAHHLEYHQQRVNFSIAKIGWSIQYNLKTLISPPDDNLYRCRFVYNDKNYTIEYIPYKKRDIKSFKIITNDNITYNLKYSDRSEIDNLFSQKDKADEIIIVKNNLLTDTSIANIALHINNRWLTPKNPLLYGTTRARLLEQNYIYEADLTIIDLKKAQKIAIMNAMVGFMVIENGIITH